MSRDLNSTNGTTLNGVAVGREAIAEQVRRDFREAGQEQSFALRVTALLERRDGRWLIQHTHISAPLAGQEPGQSFRAEAPAGGGEDF